MENIFVVIPTLNPNIDLLDSFIQELKKEFTNILVYNDGSREKYDDYFKKLSDDGVIVLKHCVNMGKGRAMKDAFNYLLNEYPDLDGVVTADSDGQHSVKDVKKCANLIKKNPESLILGCRDFDDKNVPKRSKLGNKITRCVLKSMVGVSLKDTQTGLRGLPKEVMLKLVTTEGERFEYETKQLIDTAYRKIPIVEYKIDTIYINENSESHFNAVTDSIKIYKLFSRFFGYTICYWILDLVLFMILYHFIGNANSIMFSTIIARTISCIYKYSVKEKLAYRGFKKMMLFIFISFVQMILSGAMVQLLAATFTNTNVVLLKVIIDIVIYIVTIVCLTGVTFGGKINEEN